MTAPGLDRARGHITLAAGGTGGHVFPAEALAAVLRARGWHVGMVTDVRGQRYVRSFTGTDLKVVEAATLSGGALIKRPWSVLSILKGVLAARAFLKGHGTAAVVGFGGYPAFPALAAARLAGIPVCLHEQNAVLGRVNRVFKGAAKAIACAVPDPKFLGGAAGRKAAVTGNPVRAPVMAAREVPYAPPGDGPDGEPINILIFGGSQGARVFGEAVPPALATLPADLRRRLKVVQQARAEDHDAATVTYEAAGIAADVRPFIEDMGAALAAAHIVIARSGATTVTELLVAGRPSILVPLPTAMDDQQTANARAVDAAGAGILLPQPEATPQHLAALIAGLIADPARLPAMAAAARAMGRTDAAEALADLVESVAAGGHAAPAAASPASSHARGPRAPGVSMEAAS